MYKYITETKYTTGRLDTYIFNKLFLLFISAGITNIVLFYFWII